MNCEHRIRWYILSLQQKQTNNTNMIELTEKAANYAAERSNQVIANALAKAYEDGYRDGYRDREDEIPVDLRCNDTEYVDLGLPSGTLWSIDYEREDGKLQYLPYIKTTGLNLPTEEQWKELFETCMCRNTIINGHANGILFIGLNGNSIKFSYERYFEGHTLNYGQNYGTCFWLKDGDDTREKKAGLIYKDNTFNTARMYMGYRLPIRLVR